jgi:hypothetical protein
MSNLAEALNTIDTETRNLNSRQLQKLWRSGELPTGILNWLIALRKADAAIISKNPRPL